MYKRIKYVSRFSQTLGAAEIDALGAQAAEKNARLGITGVLMASGGLFYQVMEGPRDVVDELMRSINADGRHSDLVVLSVEDEVAERLYPDWSMQTINLDAASHVRLMPLKALIKAVFEQRRVIDNMTWAIDRAIQQEMDE